MWYSGLAIAGQAYLPVNKEDKYEENDYPGGGGHNPCGRYVYT